MTTEVSADFISTESSVCVEMKKQKLRSRQTLFCELLGWLGLIAFFAGMLLAINQCMALGVKVIMHEIADHVRINRGF